MLEVHELPSNKLSTNPNHMHVWYLIISSKDSFDSCT